MQKLKCTLNSFFNSRRAGFTLLELTISITMIGFIVLIIVGALRLGFRSVESGEKKIETLERIRSSINIINSQIQSQIPLKYTEEAEERYYFKGKNEFMQFATNYSIWGGEKGYVIATYRSEPGDNGKQTLFASESIIGMDLQRETKLFDTFDRVYFEYFYIDPVEQQGYWVKQLPDEDIIPEKVKLHLVDGSKELVMVIPVRVNGSPVEVFGASERLFGPFFKE
jgi:type II secretory pathway pseudopilin PulG